MLDHDLRGGEVRDPDEEMDPDSELAAVPFPALDPPHREPVR